MDKTKPEFLDSPVKLSGENGTYSKHEWIAEAKGKLICAKILRDESSARRKSLDEFLKENRLVRNEKYIFECHEVVDAANKSSFLSLGYAIELLLKSGLVSIWIDLPKKIFRNLFKQQSHDLYRMALLLQIEITDDEVNLLRTLTSCVTMDARYPIEFASPEEYFKNKIRIESTMSDEQLFNLGIDFFKKINEIINRLDGTRDSVKCHGQMKVGSNSYFTYRIGGNLKPIVIVDFPDKNDYQLKDFKKFLQDSIEYTDSIVIYKILNYWDNTSFYKISKNEKSKITFKIFN